MPEERRIDGGYPRGEWTDSMRLDYRMEMRRDARNKRIVRLLKASAWCAAVVIAAKYGHALPI